MSNSDRVSRLFPDENEIAGADTDAVFAALKKYDLQKLGYAGEVGCNPGYIFRGELNFPVALQSSLEGSVRGYEAKIPIRVGELVRCERELTSAFIDEKNDRNKDGQKGELAVLARYSDRWISNSDDEVVWWLSLMQHYGHCTRLLDFTRDIRFALFFALEHYFKCEKKNGNRILLLYCLPCKNPKNDSDAENNKTPFDPFELLNGSRQMDVNLALGCAIGLSAMMKNHESHFDERYVKTKKLKRHWGWDLPAYDNHRLRRQKGMFVYPYNLPSAAKSNDDQLEAGESWFVRNLSKTAENYFTLAERPAKRLRIRINNEKEAETLWAKLKEDDDPLTPATVYLDFEKVNMKPGHYCRRCSSDSH